MLKPSTWVLKVTLILAFTVFTACWVEASTIQVGPTEQVVPTGSVTGQVVDQTGAVVPGATVTVTNDSIGHSATAKTDADGNFTIRNFPVGAASIKVTADGFRVVQLSGLTVSVGQALSQHIVLPLGSLSEPVMAIAPSPDGAVAPGGPVGPHQQAATQQQHKSRPTADRFSLGNTGRLRYRDCGRPSCEGDTIRSSVSCIAPGGDGRLWISPGEAVPRVSGFGDECSHRLSILGERSCRRP